MARRSSQQSARLSRGQRGSARGAAWKKSKPLAYILIAFILILWIHVLKFSSKDTNLGKVVPTTYMCRACKVVFDQPSTANYLIECTSCHKKEAYIAYECHNPKCMTDGKPYVFPMIPEIPPEDLKRIQEYEAWQKKQLENPSSAESPSGMDPMGMGPDGMGPMGMGPMGMDPMGMGMVMEATAYPGRCPKCRMLSMDPQSGLVNENIKQHRSKEAQEILDEIQRAYEERKKNR